MHEMEHIRVKAQWVEVAVFAPLPGRFTYRWPFSLGTVCEGVRVRVPFGRGQRLGMVCVVLDQLPASLQQTDILMVQDRLDAKPLLDSTRRRWLTRLCRYYLAPEGEVLETALAWAVAWDAQQFRCPDHASLQAQFPALAAVFHGKRPLSRATIVRRCSDTHAYYQLSQAIQAELLQAVDGRQDVAKSQAETQRLTLNAAQQQACDALIAGRDTFSPFLLFGRTGSGKTEVYLRAAEAIVRDGGQVLVLVPEIGLTPMWLQRVMQRFDAVGIWHSGLGKREKMHVAGQLEHLDVLIGTRSALFLPLPRLCMIVVDEEHDSSFKQQDGMRYSARDMAVLLAQQLQIPVVLGSATPAQESWRKVREGSYTLLHLPDRIASSVQARPEIVDLRGSHEVIAPALQQALQQTLEQGEQSILFLNRRGFASALQCTACGDVAECPHCSMRLTLHRRIRRLCCHTCGYTRRVQTVCAQCGEEALLPLGEGTEKVEAWLREHVPDYRFARFDRDAVRSSSAMIDILESFARGDLDGLLGTQMLVKGHHFPNVTLVGVINADHGMSMPDFRAGERWWQQMVQVMGRCGRGERAGRVLIQTRMPESIWLTRLMQDDQETVLDEELELRRQLSFPPFSRWVRLLLVGRKREQVWQSAERLAAHVASLSACQISGPMFCPVERVAGKFRVEVLLRDASRQYLPWQLAPLLATLKLPSAVRLKVDVDPQDMM